MHLPDARVETRIALNFEVVGNGMIARIDTLSLQTPVHRDAITAASWSDVVSSRASFKQVT